MTRIFLIIAAIGVFIVGTTQLAAQISADDWSSYDEAEFVVAQKKGKTIVVEVHADWCDTCRAQAPILDKLREVHQDSDVLFVKVDYNEEKEFLRENRISHKSTVLVFNGTNEVARAIAETNHSRLRDIVLSAL